MRTVLDIEDSVPLTIKEIARDNRSAGEVISRLLGDSLEPKSHAREYRNGVPLLPRRPAAPLVTTELINRLRDEDE